jgi:hypothetical protein
MWNRSVHCGGPSRSATAAPGITPELKEMMLANAKMAISAAAMRQMIVEQYRLAGIPIDEHCSPLWLSAPLRK